MKKILFVLLSGVCLSSCVSEPVSVLNKGEYTVIDTINISRNGFNHILGYDVVIKIDSSLHYGELNSNGNLIMVNPRKIKYK